MRADLRRHVLTLYGLFSLFNVFTTADVSTSCLCIDSCGTLIGNNKPSCHVSIACNSHDGIEAGGSKWIWCTPSSSQISSIHAKSMKKSSGGKGKSGGGKSGGGKSGGTTTGGTTVTTVTGGKAKTIRKKKTIYSGGVGNSGNTGNTGNTEEIPSDQTEIGDIVIFSITNNGERESKLIPFGICTHSLVLQEDLVVPYWHLYEFDSEDCGKRLNSPPVWLYSIPKGSLPHTVDVTNYNGTPSTKDLDSMHITLSDQAEGTSYEFLTILSPDLSIKPFYILPINGECYPDNGHYLNAIVNVDGSIVVQQFHASAGCDDLLLCFYDVEDQTPPMDVFPYCTLNRTIINKTPSDVSNFVTVSYDESGVIKQLYLPSNGQCDSDYGMKVVHNVNGSVTIKQYYDSTCSDVHLGCLYTIVTQSEPVIITSVGGKECYHVTSIQDIASTNTTTLRGSESSQNMMKMLLIAVVVGGMMICIL